MIKYDLTSIYRTVFGAVVLFSALSVYLYICYYINTFSASYAADPEYWIMQTLLIASVHVPLTLILVMPIGMTVLFQIILSIGKASHCIGSLFIRTNKEEK